MSKKRGPRGWKATIWGGDAEVYVVTEHRGSIAGRIYLRARNADVDIAFKDIKVRRCPEIDHLPDGFWRECWRESVAPYGCEPYYIFSKEDRDWMASLREPDARAMRRGAETVEVAA